MTDVLKDEVETLERLQRSAQRMAELGVLSSLRRQEEADHLKTVIDFLKLNAKTLKRCANCSMVFNGSHSKLFCSDKCRMNSNYKKIKK